jgi:hypothetical protein
LYEVVYIQPEQEALASHTLSGKPEEVGKRLIIVEDVNQIDNLTIPGAVGFCTVTDNGEIQYYQRK